ncbi:MAG: sensor domain-containing diguanylate cyclase, partial [Syntrophales bacterium]
MTGRQPLQDVSELLQVIRDNEEIARKFFEIETSILSIRHFKDFLQRLLREIREKFDIPHVWIALIEGSEPLKLLETIEAPQTVRRNLRTIAKETLFRLTDSRRSPVLINDQLKDYEPILPEQGRKKIRSLAIVPLTLDREVIGSLNLADSSDQRYAPGMETTLLEQLAVKVSICLSNVMAQEKLRMLAFQDTLTGLLNRRVLEEALRREFSRAARYGTPLSVVFLDLDHFKELNDLHGRDFGDEALKYVAVHLRVMSRESDIVARFAGDEFVVILPHTEGENAFRFSDRIQTFFLTNPMRRGETHVTL